MGGEEERAILLYCPVGTSSTQMHPEGIIGRKVVGGAKNPIVDI